MTASFALLFGLAGIAAALAAAALAASLPWLGTAAGAGLILLAGVLASGREPATSLGPRLAPHLRTATRNRGRARGPGGYAVYGVAYGLASLGCTLPVFLAVAGTSLHLHGPAGAVWQFVLFGLGMGTVLAVLTIATAWTADGLLRQARTLGRPIGWASAVLLWLAGAYVVYYWLTAIRLS
jgi:cytochrome c-type biogenesis protein